MLNKTKKPKALRGAATYCHLTVEDHEKLRRIAAWERGNRPGKCTIAGLVEHAVKLYIKTYMAGNPAILPNARDLEVPEKIAEDGVVPLHVNRSRGNDQAQGKQYKETGE